MSLALSTAWNSFRHSNGREIINEIKRLGFDTVELNFSLTSLMVEEIASSLQKSDIEIVSLHNFCPIPQGVKIDEALPDYYSLASLDEEERLKAVKQTKKTVDTAQKLKAKVVILHSGRVEVNDKTRDLIAFFEKGLKNSLEYRILKDRMLEERKLKSKRHLDSALKSLDELSMYAAKKDIYLGLENRFYFSEIPSFEEIAMILKDFKDSNVFYWHDVGHAQVSENLGFTQHLDFLNFYGNRMIGIHLHDILGCDDHRAPLKGEFDFRILKPYISKATIKVMEAHHPATFQDIKEGKKFIESLFKGLIC